MTRYPPHLNLFGPIHIHRAAADQYYCWLIFSQKNPFTSTAFLAAGCWWCWCSDKGPTHLSMVHDESTLDTVLKEIRTPRRFLLLNVFCPIPSHNLSQSSPSSPQSSQVQWQGNLEPSCGHTVVSHSNFIFKFLVVIIIVNFDGDHTPPPHHHDHQWQGNLGASCGHTGPEIGQLTAQSVGPSLWWASLFSRFLFKFCSIFYSIFLNFFQFFSSPCGALIMMSVIVLKIEKLKSWIKKKELLVKP